MDPYLLQRGFEFSRPPPSRRGRGWGLTKTPRSTRSDGIRTLPRNPVESPLQLERESPQTPGNPGQCPRGPGDSPAPRRREEVRPAAQADEQSGTRARMEEVVHRDNLWRALRRVEARVRADTVLVRQPRPGEAVGVTSTVRLAGCGQADRPVVWQGSAPPTGRGRPYADQTPGSAHAGPQGHPHGRSRRYVPRVTPAHATSAMPLSMRGRPSPYRHQPANDHGGETRDSWSQAVDETTSLIDGSPPAGHPAATDPSSQRQT